MKAKVQRGSYRNPNTKSAIETLSEGPRKGVFVNIDESLYDEFRMRLLKNKEKMGHVMTQMICDYVDSD